MQYCKATISLQKRSCMKADNARTTACCGLPSQLCCKPGSNSLVPYDTYCTIVQGKHSIWLVINAQQNQFPSTTPQPSSTARPCMSREPMARDSAVAQSSPLPSSSRRRRSSNTRTTVGCVSGPTSPDRPPMYLSRLGGRPARGRDQQRERVPLSPPITDLCRRR